MASQ
jgi:hypothetical protein